MFIASCAQDAEWVAAGDASGGMAAQMTRYLTPTIDELPAPPPGSTGWPWTEGSKLADAVMLDGSEWPLVSVVTPSFNQGQYLEETIRSVLLQGYPRLEYFVLDGGSRDGSLDVIRKYEKWITRWRSCKDGGQADAIATGLEWCNGEWFNFINSDDLLAPGTIAAVAEVSSNADMVAGVCENFGVGQSPVAIQNRNLSANALLCGTEASFHQPAVWMRKDLIQLCGGLQRDLHYCFDLDLMIRYLAKYPVVSYTQSTLAKFRLHEASKTVSQLGRFSVEREVVMLRLKHNDDVSELHAEADLAVRRLRWWRELMRIGEQPAGLSKAWRIVARSIVDPRIRWTRLTAGAVRRAL